MVFYLSERPHRASFLRFTHFTTLVVLCLTILISTFSSSLFVKAEDQSCTVTNETKYFNLNDLKKTKGEDWIVNGYGTDWTFYINICNDVLSKPGNGIGIYGKKLQTDYYSLGKTNTQPIVRGDKLIMEFEDKEYCGNTNYLRTSVISFICDRTVEDQGQPVFVSSFKDCAFFFEWKTPAACPTTVKGAGMGGWNVFFTIFIIALIVYFIGGIVYNRMVHRASGMHQIPNWEFWCNAWDYLKDMSLIILAQCPVINLKPRRSGGRNYRNLPRDEENVLMEEEFEEH